MSNPVTGIRIEQRLKESASLLLEKQGLTLSGAVNSLLHETLRRGGFPLELAPRDKDYVELYLQPIMNERFKNTTLVKSPTYLRKRLSVRKDYLYGYK